MTKYEHLTDEQVEQFLSRGHVCLKGAIPREKAEDWAKNVWTRLGYAPNDKATWEQARIHMPTLNYIPIAECSPQAWGAICELLGGEDRIQMPALWGDGFIANLGAESHAHEWESPMEQKRGLAQRRRFFPALFGFPRTRPADHYFVDGRTSLRRFYLCRLRFGCPDCPFLSPTPRRRFAGGLPVCRYGGGLPRQNRSNGAGGRCVFDAPVFASCLVLEQIAPAAPDNQPAHQSA